jgi:hypothetical protein
LQSTSAPRTGPTGNRMRSFVVILAAALIVSGIGLLVLLLM